jgi:hypothetical protein
LHRPRTKPGFPLKFDKLSPGDESLIGSIEIYSRRNRSEVLTGTDLRIAGKVTYKPGSGAAYEGW